MSDDKAHITWFSFEGEFAAPQISETTFAGILARVNGQKLISVFFAER